MNKHFSSRNKLNDIILKTGRSNEICSRPTFLEQFPCISQYERVLFKDKQFYMYFKVELQRFFHTKNIIKICQKWKRAQKEKKGSKSTTFSIKYRKLSIRIP